MNLPLYWLVRSAASQFGWTWRLLGALPRWTFLLGTLSTGSLVSAAPNTAPVNTMPASYSTTEDMSLSVTGISIADADAGSGLITMTFTVTSGTLTATSGGGVTVTGSGTATLVLTGTRANLNTRLASVSRPVFNPAANYTGAVTLTLVTNDNGNTGTGGAMTDTDARTITVTAVNDAPVAGDDVFSTNESTALVAQSVSGNDVDVDNTSAQLTWSLVSGGTATDNGQLTFNSNGTFTYTPFIAFNGSVSFSYQLCDLAPLCDPATVTINVTSVSDVPLVTVNNGNLVYNGSFEAGGAGWTSNSGCMDVQAYTTFGVPQVHGGSIVEIECVPISPVTTPAYFEQTVTTVIGRTYVFSCYGRTRHVGDAMQVSMNGVAALSVRMGTPWTAYAFLYTATSTSTTIRLTSLGSLMGAVNPGDGDGALVDDIRLRELDHTTTYTENAAWTAITLTDQPVFDMDHTNLASMTVTLTNPQTGDAMLVNGSSAASGTASGISYTRTATTVTFTGSATKLNYAQALQLVQFTNTTDDPSTVQRDVTTVINDGVVNSNTAHTYINVIPVNDAPVAANDEYSTNKNVALSAQLIRANDSDVDNITAQITWSLASGGTAAANGTLVVNANGTFDFTPNNEFLGSVSFTYNMCDVGGLCSSATVTITVVSPLPVELLTFDGRNEGPVNHLFWATATEHFNDRFEVERSMDAVRFERIGEVAGAGTTLEEQHYAYVDQDPFQGVNYYRLKQVDTDGGSTYTTTIHLFVDKVHSDVSISTMDPAGYFVVQVPSVGGTQVSLWSPAGQLMRTAEVVEGRCEVDLRGDAAGLYVLRVQSAGGEESFTLMRP